MLRAVLTRCYAVQPSGNSRASLRTSDIIQRIHDLYCEGKGPIEIAATLGISRKQVARVIAEAKPTEAEADPVPKKAQRQEDFQGQNRRHCLIQHATSISSRNILT